ncbi:MAG: cob(I)yrinic acid a,c-diamide adenosyltransferase [Bacteroidales bacterium]|nr:cob(I)yrinic acid a,c-diamide adenosyltransferase [Bacteroidales bacterium]
MSRIYTKTGDKGETSLIGGSRVKKNHPRIEAYGTIDELNSYIGLIRSQEIPVETITALIEIQKHLFIIGSILATDSKIIKKNPFEISEENIKFLEDEIDKMNIELPVLKSFILPGGNLTVSFCHIARCVCRRAERIVFGFSSNEYDNSMLKIYLNRLSDYLFVLARKVGKDTNLKVTHWLP